MDSKPRPKIILGPYFVGSTQNPDETAKVSESVVGIGVVMEFATTARSYRIPLFRNIYSFDPRRLQLENLQLHSKDIPCDVEYRPFYATETVVGTFIPLDAVLAGIFREFKVERSLLAVLSELLEVVNLGYSFSCLAGCLIDPLEKDGFELSLQSSYGRSVCGVICWVPPSQRKQTPPGGILVSSVDFRPRPDGTLGKGSWKEPWKECLSSELCRLLRDRVRATPFEILTDFGKEKLLATFEWTPLARLTTKQAKGARIEFIRANPHLQKNIRSLAEALRNAHLYAESTTVHQVMKFLPGLIQESKVPTA